MKKTTQETITEIIFIIVLIFVGVSLIINSTKSCDVYIDYDVTVDSITNNTGSITEIKLACYKLCVDELKNNYDLMRDCLDKCERLK